MRYKALFGALAVACASTLFGSHAQAGHSTADSVYVSQSADGVYVSASGSLMDAINTGGALQFIGCEVSAYSSGMGVYCSARNAAGTLVSCYTNNPQMAAAVAGANRFSLISFSGASGSCTSVMARYQSSYGQ